MEEYPLLATKLYIPPVRPELVSRPRLIGCLNAGLNRKLTLISAPAGFGKTTLVSEWSHEVGAHRDAPQVAWLSLDKGDNDPTRFLAYVITALRTLALSADGTPGVEGPVLSGVDGTEARQVPVGLIGKGVLSALRSPQPPPAEAVLIQLINEITALPDRILLVLDEYHLIEAQPIHDALTFLLEHLPPPPGGMHLVIATREDLPLPLARLRARGQLTELRATDLRFTSSEAAEFLNQVMGLDLSAEDIAVLETRTEGWIAGLQLAALSMQGHKDATSLIQAFTGSHRFVLDYLIEEVLEQQTESIQTFLLQTSVLNRLTGSLCDAVRFGPAESHTGQDNGQATLEVLDRANLFIVPLDEERRWYRYHHLFADLLRQRLRQTQLEQVPMLHIRASEWYERNGFIDQAIDHALCAEDYEWATHLIEEHAFEHIYLSQITTVHRWLGALPGDFIRSRPILGVIHAWVLMLGPTPCSKELLEQRLQQVEKARAYQSRQLAQSQERDHRDCRWINGHVATIRASKARIFDDDHQTTVDLLGEALSLLPDQDLRLKGIIHNNLGLAHLAQNSVAEAEAAFTRAKDLAQSCDGHYTILFAASHLADIALRRGQMQAAMQICQRVLPSLHGPDSLSEEILPIHGAVYIPYGYILLEHNNLADAEYSLTRGIELIQLCGEMEILLRGFAYLARLKQAQGDPDSALRLLEGARRVWPDADAYIDALVANLWLKHGDRAMQHFRAALRWAQNCCNVLEKTDEIPAAIPSGERTFSTLMTVSKGLIASRRIEESVDLFPVHRFLEQQIDFAELRGWRERVIELSILEALALQADCADVKALSSLRRAVELAEPEGYIRVFLDEGPPMAHLLYEALSRGIAPDYVRRLLTAFPIVEPEQTGPSKSQVPESELVEPLSERELKVLQLIAEGLTNREIASRLYLSLNTVKGHTRNIYGKLGVHSRTQAVARARAFGILPST